MAKNKDTIKNITISKDLIHINLISKQNNKLMVSLTMTLKDYEGWFKDNVSKHNIDKPYFNNNNVDFYIEVRDSDDKVHIY